MLSISHNHKRLNKDENDFFYLADTCWSAFTNITEDEWAYYLDVRKSQGFNVLQINILPQWDASQTKLGYTPFEEIDGKYDYKKINQIYFEHAREMCKVAKNKGFELALTVLWCNYVPDTWCNKHSEKGIIPYECVDLYIEKIHDTFSDLNPIYVISGDTDFETELCISYYVKAAKLLKNLAPNLLFTTHIRGRYTFIPEALLQYLDFIYYQSGHNALNKGNPYLFAEEMKKKYPGMPLINSEPCYEEMGYSGNLYGRWTQFDIRRAAWMSILSGAEAGITYGAAGIYSWHRVNMAFDTSKGEGFATPKPWQDALQFAGSWDYGYIKFFLESNQICDLTPRQDWLTVDNPEIRIAGNEDRIVIYSYNNISFSLNQDFSGYTAHVFDLETRYVSELEIRIEHDHTYIPMHRFHHDVIILLKKN